VYQIEVQVMLEAIAGRAKDVPRFVIGRFAHSGVTM
jgi:hypothetical protein